LGWRKGVETWHLTKPVFSRLVVYGVTTMSTSQILSVGTVLALDGAYLYTQKVVVPKTLEAFMKANTSTQLSVGGLAGTCANMIAWVESIAEIILLSGYFYRGDVAFGQFTPLVLT